MSRMQDYLNACASAATGWSLTVRPPVRDGRRHAACTSRPSQDSLAVLSRTAPTAPGLHTLRVEARVADPAAAALLSAALLHHSTLSSLNIPNVVWIGTPGAPTPAEAIYRTLPRLSQLTSLSASIPTGPVQDPAATEATIRALAAAIAALPALASVTLTTDTPLGIFPPQLPAGTTLPHKRRRGGGFIGRAASPSLDPVIAALSTAPALTSLSLPWLQVDAKQLAISRLHGAFAALHSLRIVLDDRSSAAPQSHPDAQPLDFGPLPVLRVLRTEVAQHARQVFPVAAVAEAAAQQPALQVLDVRGAASADACDTAPRPAEPPAGVITTSPHLHLRLDLEVCLSQGQDHGAGLNSLSRLSNPHRLTLSFGEYFRWARTDAGPQVWLAPLATLHSLRDLEVESTAGVLSGSAATALLVMPVSDLTQLTGLSLFVDVEVSQEASDLVEQVSGLTKLQRLRVGGLSMLVEEFLAPLTNLTQLELAVSPLDMGAVRVFAACAARMPRLREGRMAGPGLVCAGWFEGLRDLPSWGRYEFGIGKRLDATGFVAEQREAVRQALIGRGACVPEACTQVDFGDVTRRRLLM